MVYGSIWNPTLFQSLIIPPLEGLHSEDYNVGMENRGPCSCYWLKPIIPELDHWQCWLGLMGVQQPLEGLGSPSFLCYSLLVQCCLSITATPRFQAQSFPSLANHFLLTRVSGYWIWGPSTCKTYALLLSMLGNKVSVQEKLDGEGYLGMFVKALLLCLH